MMGIWRRCDAVVLFGVEDCASEGLPVGSNEILRVSARYLIDPTSSWGCAGSARCLRMFTQSVISTPQIQLDKQ